MAVTRVRDVPARFAISAWVCLPDWMIFESATVNSERNSISAVSAMDKPRASPSSFAERTVTTLLALDFAIQNLPKPLATDFYFVPGCLLSRFPEPVKHNNRLFQLDEIEHTHGGCLVLHPELVRARSNVGHRPAQRQPQADAFLNVAKRLADILLDRRLFIAN